ncbi:MAG TPA: SDR family NAD(P)-dependent oxidoreductase [Lentisphaeria bacterium]|nr:SDR family NAD(P)-dependent oxidoreductase [Lentisphaeria bacterium]
MKFEDRTAFITGAAGRIGRALAHEFGKYGVKLYLADINFAGVEKLCSALNEDGIEAHPIQLNVMEPRQIAETAEAVLAEAGRVDILVNNAGKWPRGSILDTSDAQWQEVIELNLTSVFRVSQAFLPNMRKNSYGRIINLGSIAGEVGLPGLCAYSAAKAGVIMLTKTMAMELATCGITVNCVSPGMIADAKQPHNGTWLGRTGTGDEVARAIAFLASDDSDYITGVDFPVDGGRILGPKGSDWKPTEKI